MTVSGIEDMLLLVHRRSEGNEVLLVFNFSKNQCSASIPVPAGHWRKRLDSAEERWRGEGSTIPKQIDTNGEVTLIINPWALVLLSSFL